MNGWEFLVVMTCSSLLELILGWFLKILLRNESVSKLALKSFIISSLESQTHDHLIFLRKTFTDVSLLFIFFPCSPKNQMIKTWMLLKYCVLELEHHQFLDLYRTQAEKTAILHCQQSSMTATFWDRILLRWSQDPFLLQHTAIVCSRNESLTKIYFRFSSRYRLGADCLLDKRMSQYYTLGQTVSRNSVGSQDSTELMEGSELE